MLAFYRKLRGSLLRPKFQHCTWSVSKPVSGLSSKISKIIAEYFQDDLKRTNSMQKVVCNQLDDNFEKKSSTLKVELTRKLVFKGNLDDLS